MSVGEIVGFLMGILVAWFAWRGFGRWCLTRIPNGTFWQWWAGAWFACFLAPVVIGRVTTESEAFGDLIVIWFVLFAAMMLVLAGWEVLADLQERRVPRAAEALQEAIQNEDGDYFTPEIREILAQRGIGFPADQDPTPYVPGRPNRDTAATYEEAKRERT